MKNIDQAINDIVGDSLSSYGVEKEKPKPTVKPTWPSRSSYESSAKTKRATYVAPKRMPKPVTSEDDWQDKYPATKTPSVFSKAEVDELLLQCRELPTPDKPIKNYAGYSREEWDKLLEVMASYMGDVMEGAGLVYKGGFSVSHFRKRLSILMQESFMHHDPYDKRNRFISVDGRIDSDERKP